MKPYAWLAALFFACSNIVFAQTLDHPTRVAIDAAGNLYVSEQPAGLIVGEVVVIAPSGAIIRRIASSGSTNSDPGYFSSIRDLAIGLDGNLYLLDGVQKRILRMSPAGAPLGAITLPATSRASAFLFKPNGQLLIADASNSSVLTLSPSGQVLSSLSVFDLPVRANEPFDIALNASGQLLVTDPDNNRIIKFDLSGAQPTRMGWLGACSSGSTCVKAPGSTVGHSNGFCNGTVAQCGAPIAARIPGGFERVFFVATDAAGDFYVTDLIQGVQHFSPTAAPLGALPRGRNVGQTGSGHISVAANGDLLVADTGNNRVSRFSRAGAPIGVVGGGLDIAVMPGDTDLNRLALTEQAPSNSAVVLASSLGYSGPVTLAATACLRETASSPFVPCASYGLSPALSASTLSLTPGGLANAQLTVTANRAIPGRTLNGKYLVAISATDASGRLLTTGQAGINVELADKFGIVATPGQLTMFPGETKNAQLALTNLSGVAGGLDLEVGIAPTQAAGHLSHTLTPRFVTTTRGTAVSATPQLQIKLSEKARSGNPNINIFAKRGTTQIGTTSVGLQIDCNCRATGAFVEPEVLPVTPSAGNPQSGTSPSGTLVVNTGFTPSGAGPIPFVSIPGKVPQVQNAAAWGFSPNEKFFVVATLNPTIPNQTFLSVFDLSVNNRVVKSVTIMGCSPSAPAACSPPASFCFGGAACLSPKGTKPSLTMGHASWGFSPDDKTFLVAQLDVSLFPSRMYTLSAFDLSRANSGVMLSQQFSGGNAFWRFSPCGDALMHFEQRAVGSAIERDARFWVLNGGQSPASRLLATAIYTGNTANNDAPSARVAAASSVPTGSDGDFDILLTHLATQGSGRIDGFQSLQCRAR